jgi:hypothetical protein
MLRSVFPRPDCHRAFLRHLLPQRYPLPDIPAASGSTKQALSLSVMGEPIPRCALASSAASVSVAAGASGNFRLTTTPNSEHVRILFKCKRNPGNRDFSSAGNPQTHQGCTWRLRLCHSLFRFRITFWNNRQFQTVNLGCTRRGSSTHRLTKGSGAATGASHFTETATGGSPSGSASMALTVK